MNVRMKAQLDYPVMERCAEEIATPGKKSENAKEAVERYIRDHESIKLPSTKFDDVNVTSRIIRLTPPVVKLYLDLVPLDS